MKKFLFLLLLCVSIGSAQYNQYPINYIFQDTTLADSPFPLTTSLGEGAYFADTTKFGQKIYACFLSQIGTADPTQTIVKNTFGDTLTWARDSMGVYHATAPDDWFPQLKTKLTYQHTQETNYGNTSTPYESWTTFYWGNQTTIYVLTFTGDPPVTRSDDILLLNDNNPTYIEIVVFE